MDWVDIAHNKAYLKLVPRIDYTRMRGALRAQVIIHSIKLLIVKEARCLFYRVSFLHICIGISLVRIVVSFVLSLF